MGRATWVDADGMRKGEWTAEEDGKLIAYINEQGLGDWRKLPMRAGLQRCGKSCRLRWLNYLRPGIKRGKFTPQEEDKIIKLHALLGNRWAAIAKQMPNRTDNDIKNLWNSCLKKRLTQKGKDPVTHESIHTVDITTSTSPTLLGPSSSSSPSSSGSARLLNKLAAGLSLRKHEFDRIKTVILSEPISSSGQAVEDVMINKENEEVIGRVMMEIDEMLNTPSFDELPFDTTSTTGLMTFDDLSLANLWESDFYEIEQNNL